MKNRLEAIKEQQKYGYKVGDKTIYMNDRAAAAVARLRIERALDGRENRPNR